MEVRLKSKNDNLVLDDVRPLTTQQTSSSSSTDDCFGSGCMNH